MARTQPVVDNHFDQTHIRSINCHTLPGPIIKGKQPALDIKSVIPNPERRDERAISARKSLSTRKMGGPKNVYRGCVLLLGRCRYERSDMCCQRRQKGVGELLHARLFINSEGIIIFLRDWTFYCMLLYREILLGTYQLDAFY